MDEFLDAPQEWQGEHLPPQLDLWLQRVEADMRATWEQSTAAALQKIRADLSTALAATDAKLAGTLDARLAETSDRLSEELSAKVDAGIAMALEAGSDGAAAPYGEQPAAARLELLAEVRAVLARVAAEQAEVRTRLSQVEAGMVDVADGLGAQLSEATERLGAELQGTEATVREGLQGTQSMVRDELQGALAKAGPDQAELQAGLAKLETAISGLSEQRLASALAAPLAEATGRLRVELAAIGREQVELRTRLTKMETAIGGISEDRLASAIASRLVETTERLRDQLTGVSREQAEVRTRLKGMETAIGGISEDRLASAVASRLAETTERLKDQLTGVAREQAGMRARLNETSDKLVSQLAQAREQADERLAAGLSATFGEVTKRLSDEVATNSSMLVGELESTLTAAAERQVQAGKEQQAHLDGAMGQLADRVEAGLEGVVETLTKALEAQTRTLEEALMSLAKVVGDERRSSAALVKGSLGATDQTLREMSQKVEEALTTVLEWSRQAHAQAAEAASQAKLVRRSLTERRGGQPPPSTGS